MAEAARKDILRAAWRLAELFKLAQLTPEIIADAASISLADFNTRFKSVSEYLDQVHTLYLEDNLERILGKTGQMPPGLERIYRGAIAQLDYCLEARAFRNLMTEARRSVPQVAESQYARNRSTAMLISLELKALGCKSPTVVARYYCLMALEAAQIESEAGAVVPDARQALRDFLAMWIPEKSRAG